MARMRRMRLRQILHARPWGWGRANLPKRRRPIRWLTFFGARPVSGPRNQLQFRFVEADAQTAIAEKLARGAFGVEPEPIRKIQTTTPVRLVFKCIGPVRRGL